MHGESGLDLVHLVALLAAAVVAVPVFKRLGLGSVLGYLAAGVLIGPSVLGLFDDPEAILNTAELGVVLLLFVIGLEMKPRRLWGLRREIFGLGVAQVAFCAALLTAAGVAVGLDPALAFVAGAGFVLSSTAIVMQIMEERNTLNTEDGQKVVSILLLEDLMIVPLLAIVAFLAPHHAETGAGSRWLLVVTAAGAIVAVIVAGRWLLTPIFGILASARAREVMTAAALLVVLGAALLMQLGGLSMAMGAFLAGVMLSESSYRNELEADIEPFRGLLLGLFFLSVGMSLDLGVMAREWPLVLGAVAGFMLLKSLGIYAVARLFRSGHRQALRRAGLLIQGGEFAFVLYNAAMTDGLMSADTAAVLNAAVIVSMALTPLAAYLTRRIGGEQVPSFDGIEAANGLSGTVLVIGFGRFGQVASQALLARGTDVATIDNDPDMIRAAARFGFKVYYGDGTRLDVLRTAGAGTAKAIAVCVDQREGANKIVELVKAEFPFAKLLVRAYDRGHALDLIQAGVDYQIRETFESALAFGEAALLELGVAAEEARETIVDLRRRDAQRLELQLAGGLQAGRDLFHRGPAQPTPTPLTPVRRKAQPLNQEAAVAAAGAEEEAASRRERTGTD